MSTKIKNPLFTRGECELIWAKLYRRSDVKHKLRNFTVQPELNSVGYLGQYFQLVLVPEDDAAGRNDQVVVGDVRSSQRLFVKTLPYANEQLCQYIEEVGILKKEASLYATLLEELKKYSKTSWCAQCYYTRNDLFVMQHLLDLDYKTSSSKMGALGSTEMNQLLSALACMHASSIAYEIITGINIGNKYEEMLYEITVSPSETYFTTGLRAVVAVIKQHPDFQTAEQQQYIENDMERMLQTVYDMVNPSKRYRNVFCHRDPWAGNMFFSQISDSPAMLVDFQTSRYCPAAIDVVFALYMNLSSIQRKEKETEYVSWYYKCFKEVLYTFNINSEQELSWLEFVASFQEFQLFGALYKAIAATMLSVPEGYLSNMKTQAPDKYFTYAYVDRTSEVLRLMKEHKDFREQMSECVVDIMTVLGINQHSLRKA